ncbi:MAG: nucleotidyltransferase family protein [Pseudomonadota bacterium]|nr:nucleotidyltransferase family protein [Pseudomonadota bacterium]
MKGVSPRTAMVLAAGLGTRMRPLTLTTPKPLVQVAGTTLLDHALDRLSAAGVQKAVVNTHWLGDQIARHVQGRPQPAVTLSPEDVLLETGGGVKKALPVLGPDPFFVINSDILWTEGKTPVLERLAQAWDDTRMDVLLLLVAREKAFGLSHNGDYVMDGEGRLSRNMDRKDQAPWYYASIQLIAPRAYADAPEGPFSNLKIWDRAQQAGRLFGLAHDAAWYSVDTPAVLDEITRLFPGKIPAARI